MEEVLITVTKSWIVGGRTYYPILLHERGVDSDNVEFAWMAQELLDVFDVVLYVRCDFNVFCTKAQILEFTFGGPYGKNR